MARTGGRKPAPATRRPTPALSVADFQRHVIAKAAEVAPSDVTGLVARVQEVHDRLVTDAPDHPSLAQRVKVAMYLLSDHAGGRCPQIPYHTVSLLAAALFYYLNPVDVIPDWIPGAGTADDALVLDVAWELGHPGIERYLVWKGIAKPRAKKPARAKSGARRRPAAR